MSATNRRGPVRYPKSKIDPAFGEWLTRMRSSRELTQVQLSQRAGNMSTETIRKLERSGEGDGLETQITVDTFVRLADALDLELGYVLYRAGFDIGASGINLSRVRRIEEAVDAFTASESIMRQAIAGAIAYVGEPEGDDPEVDRLIADLGRALGAHDLVCERLRQEGFLTGHWQPEEMSTTYRRPWTTAEEHFLRAHRELSHEEVARQLFRTADAVRAKRGYIKQKEES